jgi:hypothetical protein
MLIEYQISEREFKRGFCEVFVPRLKDKNNLKTLLSLLAGLLLIVVSVRDFVRSGFSVAKSPLLLVVLVMLLAYTLLWRRLSRGARRTARQIYRNTGWLRGRMFLDVNEEGIRFTGENFFMMSRWTEFVKFFEDRRTFILHQRNPQPAAAPFIFHIVPKRNLSSDQVGSFRQYLLNRIPAKKASPARSMARS